MQCVGSIRYLTRQPSIVTKLGSFQTSPPPKTERLKPIYQKYSKYCHNALSVSCSYDSLERCGLIGKSGDVRERGDPLLGYQETNLSWIKFVYLVSLQCFHTNWQGIRSACIVNHYPRIMIVKPGLTDLYTNYILLLIRMKLFKIVACLPHRLQEFALQLSTSHPSLANC